MNAAAALRMYEMDSRPWGRRRGTLMLLMRVERWDVRRDGPLTEVALRHKIEALGYEVSPRMFAAGTMAAAQVDPRERLHAVIRGLVKVTLDGESAILAAGDMVFVPRGSMLRVEAIGATGAACFDAAYRTGAA